MKKKTGWVSVWEDLPPVAPGWNQCSRNVRIKLEDGSEVIGYYAHQREQWFDEDGRRVKVVAWRNVKG